ncbi:TetR family transcriptional regulator [Paenibacillus aceti]|uniref:TetR family transcriptional regulator n=1 Tax=Paenibacillus aceti TaxID=1820010 RepID=A0ABQ1W018_9BACL|nr:TetR family transcriptional regulator [Paenibacillus aceti]GGG06325.1 TetR family transcriptional regulator [Paenibacillus aceti]
MAPKVSEDYKQARRRELLQAAKRVFIQKGFVHTSMQDIMDEAGISRGAFYSYFDNIDHVFMEVLKYEDQQIIQFLAPPAEGSVWQHLKRWVEDQQGYIESLHDTLLLAKSEFFLSSLYVKNKENFPYISDRYDETAAAIEEAIEEGIRRGEFRTQLRPGTMARFLISFMNGLMLDTYQLGRERTRVEEQLAALLFSLEQMLSPVQG